MSSIEPGYGETPPFDEIDALLPAVRAVLDKPITMAAVYDLEQAAQERVLEDLMANVLEAELGEDHLLSDHFLRELHRRLYSDI